MGIDRLDTSGACGRFASRSRSLRPLLSVSVVMASIAIGCGQGPAMPADLRAGRDIYGDTCATCHGNSGQGGVGPALADVLAVWPSCDDQREWVTLGSAGWKAAHGDTYGATDIVITGEMPGHGERLSELDIARVVAFERVQYGGGDAEAELRGCGLATD